VREAESDEQRFESYAWDEVDGRGLAHTYYLAGSYEPPGGRGSAEDRQSFGRLATLYQATLT
jgi:hypothetical protein